MFRAAAGECGLVWASGHCSADCASSPRPACLCQLVMVADSCLSSQSPPASELPKASAVHGDLPPRQQPSCDCCLGMRVRVWHLLIASSAGGVCGSSERMGVEVGRSTIPLTAGGVVCGASGPMYPRPDISPDAILIVEGKVCC